MNRERANLIAEVESEPFGIDAKTLPGTCAGKVRTWEFPPTSGYPEIVADAGDAICRNSNTRRIATLSTRGTTPMPKIESNIGATVGEFPCCRRGVGRSPRSRYRERQFSVPAVVVERD